MSEMSELSTSTCYISEEIEISNYPLLENNDIESESDANMYRPKVWAQTRQELCETLSYFKSYQGGVYHKNLIVYAYLMDAFGAKRDVCNGRVIISHGGGKSSKQINGKYGLSRSQLPTDSSVKSLLNNYNEKRPVIIIVGNKCSIANFKVPARYCVLGIYLITHAWPEYEVTEKKNDYDDMTSKFYFVRWKFRFEWMMNQKFEPWWETPKEIIMNARLFNNLNSLNSHTCHVCKKISIQIYEIWFCLNHSCKLFWQYWNVEKNNWEIIPPDQELIFNEIFLNPGFIPNELSEHALAYNIIPSSVPDEVGYTSLHWKGYHCLRCGRLSCRTEWNGWECLNCHRTQSAQKVILDRSLLVNPYSRYSDLDNSVLNGSNIVIYQSILSSNTKLIIYILPEGGQIFHFMSNEKYNEKPDLFLKKFQEINNVNLKRHTLKGASNIVGSNLVARQFSINIGTHYSHTLNLNSVSWLEAPEVCRETFEYIQKIVENFISEANDFNEMLSMIYMEGQRMSWHDDGEIEVGSVIASLSLGSSAVMKFRKKQEKLKKGKKVAVSTKECNKKRKTNSNNFSKRKKVKIDQIMEPKIDQLMEKKKDQIMKPKFEKSINTSKVFIKGRALGPELLLTLHHGDIIVMNGKVVQKNYEHMVIPKGFRIASTIRHISR